MKKLEHKVDFCVIGGGLAGLCAAVAAARKGLKVALIHDRPVLGGNASSEIRMWIGGAHGRDKAETGILEEIMLENLWRNPLANYSIWDTVLYEKACLEPGLSLFLNCSVNAVESDGDRIRSVTGWQLTTETWHRVEAPYFADCTGDGLPGALAGAEFRLGREARGEFNEDIAPDVADRKTMGMSCLLQLREHDKPQSFVKPDWAYTYPTDASLNGRNHGKTGDNFWWIEVGGDQDVLHDAETCRDELLKIALGVWDHIKNQGDHGMANWSLDWLGFLPGKRESRRFVGEHVLNQNDVRSGGRFDDLVAYGGWSMDDHFPEGFHHPGKGTIFHPAPSPYGIPLRSLYSRNIKNLFFAGRNMSATHTAMSSARVMATCAICGQAVGTAAALAYRYALMPGDVYQQRLKELQQVLMEDDCWLPGFVRAIPALSKQATLSASCGDPEPLRNGMDRPAGDAVNCWCGAPGAEVTYDFGAVCRVARVRLVFDSDLNRGGGCGRAGMDWRYSPGAPDKVVPATLVQAFRLEALDGQGRWHIVAQEKSNRRRLVNLSLDVNSRAIRFIPESTWGDPVVRVFGFEVSD
jgi:hypothetical protein